MGATFTESADTIHGRLMEGVHIVGYTFERACMSLKWLLTENRWREIGDGFDDVNSFLNTLKLTGFQNAVTERKEIARLLAEIGASQRATARALGVDEKTIRRDVNPAAPAATPSLQHKELQDTNAANAAPARPNPLAVAGEEAAKTVEKQATKAYDKAVQYGHDKGDDWYTPKWLFDALGLHFSIDVCAPEDLTHITTPAGEYFNPTQDGLKQKWHGTVWCNPPYSDPEPWALKCIQHGDGLLLTHIPMNAEWCMRVWNSCDAIRLFQAMEFVRPDGTVQRPGNWLQLAAFGTKARTALAKKK